MSYDCWYGVKGPPRVRGGLPPPCGPDRYTRWVAPCARGFTPPDLSTVSIKLEIAPCTRGFTRHGLMLRRDVHGRPVYAGFYPDPHLVKTLDQRPHHRRIPGRVQGIRLRQAGHGRLQLLPPTADAPRPKTHRRHRPVHPSADRHHRPTVTLEPQPIPRLGRLSPTTKGVHFTADYIVDADDNVAFLEGGPPHHLGAHPCCFPMGETPVPLRSPRRPSQQRIPKLALHRHTDPLPRHDPFPEALPQLNTTTDLDFPQAPPTTPNPHNTVANHPKRTTSPDPEQPAFTRPNSHHQTTQPQARRNAHFRTNVSANDVSTFCA